MAAADRGTHPSLAAAAFAPESRMLKTARMQRFTDTARIDVDLPEGANHVWLNIWNRFGLEVRLLLDESDPDSGPRQLTWDGLDDEGNPVPAGIYIFRLTVDGNADSGSLYLERSPE